MLRSGNSWPSKLVAHVSASVRNASTSVRKRFQTFAPSPSSYRCCGFWTVVVASRVKGSLSHGAWGRAGWGSVAALWCEKFMIRANSHRDAAPWVSHLGNFICFWKVTSLLHVKSDRDETPWVRHPGHCRHFWSLVSSSHVRHAHCRRQGRLQFAMLACGRVFVACDPVVGMGQ